WGKYLHPLAKRGRQAVLQYLMHLSRLVTLAKMHQYEVIILEVFRARQDFIEVDVVFLPGVARAFSIIEKGAFQNERARAVEFGIFIKYIHQRICCVSELQPLHVIEQVLTGIFSVKDFAA